jgi:hypothetical protein
MALKIKRVTNEKIVIKSVDDAIHYLKSQKHIVQRRSVKFVSWANGEIVALCKDDKHLIKYAKAFSRGKVE